MKSRELFVGGEVGYINPNSKTLLHCFCYFNTCFNQKQQDQITVTSDDLTVKYQEAFCSLSLYGQICDCEQDSSTKAGQKDKQKLG